MYRLRYIKFDRFQKKNSNNSSLIYSNIKQSTLSEKTENLPLDVFLLPVTKTIFLEINYKLAFVKDVQLSDSRFFKNYSICIL